MECLDTVQWIQGASSPLPSKWLDLLRQIQAAGKSVQLLYAPGHGGDADLFQEVEILCRALDPGRLFVYAVVDTVERAERLVAHTQQVCGAKG